MKSVDDLLIQGRPRCERVKLDNSRTVVVLPFGECVALNGA